MPIWKDALQQNAVGGLRSGAVDRRDLDAEVVDDALFRTSRIWRGVTSVVAILDPSLWLEVVPLAYWR